VGSQIEAQDLGQMPRRAERRTSRGSNSLAGRDGEPGDELGQGAAGIALSDLGWPGNFRLRPSVDEVNLSRFPFSDNHLEIWRKGCSTKTE
jgi:hypothetical protein